MKHYKSAEFLSNLNVKQPLHKRSPLLTTFWRRLCMYPRLGSSRPVTSLGHQGWRRVFWEGPKFFKLDPIVFNYAQHIFPGGGRKILFFWLWAWEALVYSMEQGSTNYGLRTKSGSRSQFIRPAKAYFKNEYMTYLRYFCW